MRTSGWVLPPGWSQSKRIFLFCARSDKKENKRLHFCPPPTTRSRLDLNQRAFSVLRARSDSVWTKRCFQPRARENARARARPSRRDRGEQARARAHRPGRPKQIDALKQEEPCGVTWPLWAQVTGSPTPRCLDRPLVVSEAAPGPRRSPERCLRAPISKCLGATGDNEKNGAALPPPRQHPAAWRGASRVWAPTWEVSQLTK